MADPNKVYPTGLTLAEAEELHAHVMKGTRASARSLSSLRVFRLRLQPLAPLITVIRRKIYGRY